MEEWEFVIICLVVCFQTFFCFVCALGLEHEDWQVEKHGRECGDTSDFLVVVCLQKILEFFIVCFQKKMISLLNDIQKQFRIQ